MFSTQDNLISVFFELTINQSSYHYVSTSTYERTFDAFRFHTPQHYSAVIRMTVILRPEEVNDALRYISNDCRPQSRICKVRTTNRIANRQTNRPQCALSVPLENPKNQSWHGVKKKITASDENRNSACPVRVLWSYRLWYVGCNYRLSIRNFLNILLVWCVWE
jgi:hypothetical protein